MGGGGAWSTSVSDGTVGALMDATSEGANDERSRCGALERLRQHGVVLESKVSAQYLASGQREAPKARAARRVNANDEIVGVERGEPASPSALFDPASAARVPRAAAATPRSSRRRPRCTTSLRRCWRRWIRGRATASRSRRATRRRASTLGGTRNLRELVCVVDLGELPLDRHGNRYVDLRRRLRAEQPPQPRRRRPAEEEGGGPPRRREQREHVEAEADARRWGRRAPGTVPRRLTIAARCR